jgi:hypothetical protein
MIHPMIDFLNCKGHESVWDACVMRCRLTLKRLPKGLD